MPSYFWQDPAFLEAWCRSGAPLLPDDIPHLSPHYSHDEMLFLWIAEGQHTCSFRHASQGLRSDRAFMMACLSLNPKVIRYIHTNELRNDFDLVTAFASSSGSSSHATPAARALLHTPLRRYEIANYIRQARRKITLNEIFEHAVLRDSTTWTRTGPSHLDLILVNQDPETIEFFKRTVARYLGILDEMQHGLVRRALANLTGAVWSRYG